MSMNSTREDFLANELSSRELWLKVTETTFSALLIATAFTGNLLVCLAIKKNDKLRKIPNYYIASLAVTDLLMSILGMPLTLVALAADGWILGDALCQYQGFVGTTLGTASLLNITLLALNRYFKIVRGQKHMRFNRTKTKVAVWSIVLIWSLAIVCPIPYLAIGNRYRFHPGKVLCFFDLDNSNIYYAVTTIVCFAMIPFGIITFCYYKVFRTVRRHNKTLAQSGSDARRFTVDEVKLAKLLFTTLLGFMACWTPFVIIDVIGVFKGQFVFSRRVYEFYTISIGLSSCVNPIIYAAMNKDFRTEFKKILTACRCKISRPKHRSSYALDSNERHKSTEESPI